MKKISKINYFLFQKKHDIVGNNTLFRFQSDLAKFAVNVPGCTFYKKTPEGIRPFLNQQLKFDGERNSKPILNHQKTYLMIVKARVKQMNLTVREYELEKFLTEFNLWFSKEAVKPLKNNFKLFDEITAEMLLNLKIVAIANGGSLTEDEFLDAFKNLKQNIAPD